MARTGAPGLAVRLPRRAGRHRGPVYHGAMSSRSPRGRALGPILVAGAGALWGTIGIAAKGAFRDGISPSDVALWRGGGGGAGAPGAAPLAPPPALRRRP